MRIDAPSPLAQAAARLRVPLERARRRLSPLLSGFGWALGATVLVVLVALAYAATFTTTNPAGLVRSGERFAADDLLKVCRALDAKSVAYRINDSRQVEVASDRLDEANTLVAKLDVGPRPLDEIDRDALETPVWASLSNNDRRQELAANERLAALIQRLDGVIRAHVEVKRPKPRGLRPATPPSAFVFLETRDDRELSTHTIDHIQALITFAEPDVKPDAVSVSDNRRIYLNPKDPTFNHHKKTTTYRDELRQEIETRLEWLKGVQVSVQVTPPPIVSPAPPVSTPAPAPAAPVAPTVAVAPAPAPVMGANQPIELAPEPVAPLLPTPPNPTPVAVAVAAPPMPTPTPTPSAPPRVRVCVSIPRS